MEIYTKEHNNYLLAVNEGRVKGVKELLRADTYNKYLKTYHWIQIRLKYKSMYGWVCVRCGKRPAHLHHKRYKRLFTRGITNLILLCPKHHKLAHNKNVSTNL